MEFRGRNGRSRLKDCVIIDIGKLRLFPRTHFLSKQQAFAAVFEGGRGFLEPSVSF